jgi:hypothetical protein
MGMLTKEQIDELIELLRQYELSIAALYDTFAGLLVSDGKPWTEFANEERLHAKWISTLHEYFEKEKLSIEQTNFTVQSTKVAISYIEKQIIKIGESDLDLLKALSIAIDVEKSLFESAFFRIFQFNGPKAVKIQSQLIQATKKHLDKLIQWRLSEQKKIAGE